ncbi:ABC transporter ATP-binding protein [Thermogemmatispora tikiterensis]|uniref:ABC transporter ATP-binding protein n=1 Tax=Thermogemmatispora tikiterensis TaxID=1825093 RepID=A0A328VGN2_9CHLR|nr:ABC transporter ATP-binding protein [Thermogemmatispora tikiterensis]RAQ96129.1 ABC transporter ATP-binding protein [Thermogemmatispora tikiterensis]
MTALIQVSGLTKYYGRSRGILDLSFEIEEGEIFGFLGPNGAGKTTTIRTLMGFLRPSAGRATIAGLDCWSQAPAVKRLVGYLPSEFAFDPGLTGAQILTYLGHLRGGVDRSYVQQLCERLDFDPGKRFREYSRGNRQKLGLIQAFMHRPRLLILDEPSSGLDPLNQQEFYRMLREVQSEGHTVFLSSHILPEVEQTCSRVGIIRDGRLVEVNEVSRLKHMRQQTVVISFPGPASPEWFQGLPGVAAVRLNRDGRELHLDVQGELQAVIKAAAAHDALSLSTQEPSLEEIFLRFYQVDQPVAAGR